MSRVPRPSAHGYRYPSSLRTDFPDSLTRTGFASLIGPTSTSALARPRYRDGWPSLPRQADSRADLASPMRNPRG
jgi:hypothetical protein